MPLARERFSAPLLLSVALVASFCTLPAQAAQILDQSLDPGIFLVTGFGGDIELAQTFTVGRTGLLTQVDVRISQEGGPYHGDLLLDIRPTVRGIPVRDAGAAFVTATIPSAGVPVGLTDFVSVDVSASEFAVTAGDVFAMVLRAPETSGHGYRWADSSTDTYLSGAAYFRGEAFPDWTWPGTYDLGFRTFVNETGVPGTVVINIAPGTYPNAVRLRRLIAVAIMTTDTFDATTVDVESVRFGPRQAHGRARLAYVDGDGRPDLLFDFRARHTGIRCGATSATLTGMTMDGQDFTASDSIVTTWCP